MWGCACCRCYNATRHLLFFCVCVPQPPPAGGAKRSRGRSAEIAQGRAWPVWPKVDAPELSSGPIWEIQEVSRVGAQDVTSKSKLLALEMPRVCSRGLRVDSGEDCRRKGGCAGPGSKVDAPEASSGPGWKIQEVSRVGAQRVTSKSKLLAREMPRECSRGLRVDSEAAKSLKVAPAQSGSKSVRRRPPRDLDGRYRR